MKALAPLCLITLALTPPGLAWMAQGRGAALKGKQAAADSKPVSRSDEAKAAAEKEQRKIAAQAFVIADYDRNGWITYKEAQASLEIDKPRFLVYDADRDGGVTEDEYIEVSMESYRKLGSFKTPLPNPDDPRSAELVAGLFGDTDDDGPVEYVPIEADSIFELFGQAEPRILGEKSIPEPDLIKGPVHAYRRLNYDNAGGISRDDLAVLLLGSGLDERPSPLLASLGTDGDDEISEEEFMASMRTRR